MTNSRRAASHFATPVLLFILALLFRLYQLGSPLWFDEISALVNSVGPDVISIVTSFTSNNDHPLYTLMTRISFDFLGESNFSYRLPSALFGALTVPVVWIFARQVTTNRIALWSALFLAVFYPAIWFSQNARGYSLLLFFALLATWALAKDLRSDRPRLSLGILYAVAAALSAYTHLTMAIFVVVQALVVGIYLVVSGKPKLLFHYAVVFGMAGLLTILFYAPMYQDVLAFFFEEKAVGTGKNLRDLGTPYWAVVELIRVLANQLGGFPQLIIVTVAIVAGGIHLLVRHFVVSLLVILPVPAVAIVAFVMQRPVFPRFYYFEAGFIVVAATVGLSIIANFLETTINSVLQRNGSKTQFTRSFDIVCIITLLALSPSLVSYYSEPKQNYDQAAAHLTEKADSSNIYLIGGMMEFPMNRYLGHDYPVLASVPQFQDVLKENADTYIAFTFPEVAKLAYFDLIELIQEECDLSQEISASIRGGEILIYQCETSSEKEQD